MAHLLLGAKTAYRGIKIHRKKKKDPELGKTRAKWEAFRAKTSRSTRNAAKDTTDTPLFDGPTTSTQNADSDQDTPKKSSLGGFTSTSTKASTSASTVQHRPTSAAADQQPLPEEPSYFQKRPLKEKGPIPHPLDSDYDKWLEKQDNKRHQSGATQRPPPKVRFRRIQRWCGRKKVSSATKQSEEKERTKGGQPAAGRVESTRGLLLSDDDDDGSDSSFSTFGNTAGDFVPLNLKNQPPLPPPGSPPEFPDHTPDNHKDVVLTFKGLSSSSSCFDGLDSPGTADLISWSDDSSAFTPPSDDEFCKDIPVFHEPTFVVEGKKARPVSSTKEVVVPSPAPSPKKRSVSSSSRKNPYPHARPPTPTDNKGLDYFYSVGEVAGPTAAASLFDTYYYDDDLERESSYVEKLGQIHQTMWKSIT